MLRDLIIEIVRKNGPISFHDFMEMCLYEPQFGYYTHHHEQIGKKGDYYTSPCLTPAFGKLIAKQLHEMWQIMGDNDFTIVEYGAGTGLLCYDILCYFKEYPSLYQKLNYYIIEKSPSMRAKQHSYLKEKVRWFGSGNELGQITGCVLTNELIDNLAVHQVVMEDQLMEIYIDYRDKFVELQRPAKDVLVQYFKDLNVVLPRHFRAEVNLDALAWMKETTSFLIKGYLLTIDYGGSSADLYSMSRSDGTLVCYNQHTVNDSMYENIGEQDITAHVNFSALSHFGSQYGLQFSGYTDQASFLLSLGFKEFLRKEVDNDQALITAIKREAMLTYILLVDMGHKYKVLLQQKGVPDHTLQGFNIHPAGIKI